jgi:cobalamin-dependent methionine synthase I
MSRDRLFVFSVLLATTASKNAIVGIYPANAVGDDVEPYTSEDRTTVRATLYGLREQFEKDSKTAPCVPSFVPAGL